MDAVTILDIFLVFIGLFVSAQLADVVKLLGDIRAEIHYANRDKSEADFKRTGRFDDIPKWKGPNR